MDDLLIQLREPKAHIADIGSNPFFSSLIDPKPAFDSHWASWSPTLSTICPEVAHRQFLNGNFRAKTNLHSSLLHVLYPLYRFEIHILCPQCRAVCFCRCQYHTVCHRQSKIHRELGGYQGNRSVQNHYFRYSSYCCTRLIPTCSYNRWAAVSASTPILTVLWPRL